MAVRQCNPVCCEPCAMFSPGRPINRRSSEMSQHRPAESAGRDVRIPAGEAMLEGELIVPAGATGLVLFAHGSGSSRHSPRNQYVARVIRESGVATLLFDLLTREEEAVD